MSCLLTQWRIIPTNSPLIIRNCSKCGQKSEYINTGNFRVNANGNNLDVWLIYQCNKCKTTYNLSIYERISPNKIPKSEYEKFLANDIDLALQYSLNKDVLRKNKAQAVLDMVEFVIAGDTAMEGLPQHNSVTVEIINPYNLPIRTLRLIASQLNLSRSKVRKLIEQGIITSSNINDLNKKVINNKWDFTYPTNILDTK
ncbi:MAG TPA: DUF1062 domain-containing protein [Clostridiales bacterium]|nr:DUF1062 domain-containing protein [Clostridiales bacterium]